MRTSVACVGIGIGSKNGLTCEALERINQAHVLIGSARLLALFSDSPAEKLELVDHTAIARAIHEQEGRFICILFSGDIGFHSGATRLAELLTDWKIERYCGISTVQYLCARLGIPWEDVHLVSAHGHPVNICREVGTWPLTFFLTGGDFSVQHLCQLLVDAHMGDSAVYVGSNLGTADEQIVSSSASNLAAKNFPSLSCMLVQRRTAPVWNWTTGGIPDNLFTRGAVPMTKSEVRCTALAKLRLGPKDTVWDVGAGTGSVSVEAALHVWRGTVCAVEHNPEAVELVRRNARTFGCSNIQVTVGKAPGILVGLPIPDAVFIGGSGGSLEECLVCALTANPEVRVVVTAVTLETVTKAVSFFENRGCLGVEATMVSISHTVQSGGVHMMRAENPVWIISAYGKGVLA